MFRKLTLATAAIALLGTAAYAGENTKSDRKVLIDRTTTQTISTEEAKACAGQDYRSGKCAGAKAKPGTHYPVNALEGLNLGY